MWIWWLRWVFRRGDIGNLRRYVVLHRDALVEPLSFDLSASPLRKLLLPLFIRILQFIVLLHPSLGWAGCLDSLQNREIVVQLTESFYDLVLEWGRKRVTWWSRKRVGDVSDVGPTSEIEDFVNPTQLAASCIG